MARIPPSLPPSLAPSSPRTTLSELSLIMVVLFACCPAEPPHRTYGRTFGDIAFHVPPRLPCLFRRDPLLCKCRRRTMLHGEGAGGWPIPSQFWDDKSRDEFEHPDRSGRREFREQATGYHSNPFQLNVSTRGANPAKLPEVQLSSSQQNRRQPSIAQLPDYNRDGLNLSPDSTTSTPGTAPALQNGMPVPIKAMMFLDGTWLYYTFYSRGSFRCPIIKQFGEDWTSSHTVDWTQVHNYIRETVAAHLPGRFVDVTRVIVFGSVRQNTSPSSPRVRMFKELEACNFEVRGARPCQFCTPASRDLSPRPHAKPTVSLPLSLSLSLSLSPLRISLPPNLLPPSHPPSPTLLPSLPSTPHPAPHRSVR